MRIADVTLAHWVNRQLAQTSKRYQDASVQATTGRRVNAPSDDPVAAAEELRQKSQLEQTGDYRKNVAAVQGDMELAESTLAQAGDVLARVREITVKASNGSVNADERAVMSDEVEELRQTLLWLANVKGSRGTLFGGTLTDGPAFDGSGNFVGNDTEQRVAVGPGTTVATNPSGALAFTAAGGRDLFADLATLRDALAGNDVDAVRASLDAIEAGQTQLSRERAHTGVVLERLSTSDMALEQVEAQLQKNQQAEVGVDLTEAYSKLVDVGQTLERSVAIARQILDIGDLSRF
ncbi:MAG: flagellar hook-associated protein FlgL [Polyangiaceae bacterium]|nr:flagellar hook-associated protein FlgL [Polyangiaceae bacterium]